MSNNISSYFSNGGTLLEVSMPHLSGASPTSFYCGNMIWRQFIEGAKANNEVRKPISSSNVQYETATVFNLPQRQEYSALHVSACIGQFKSANALLENNENDVNKQDHNGNTPLIWAASEGNDDIVQILLDSRADVNMQNFYGETALFLAASRGYDVICSMLMENGANPNIPNLDGSTAAHMAAASGHSNVLMILINRAAFVNGQDDCGDTPLHYAVREEQYSIVEMLVTRCHASVDIQNDDQETPLQLASCLECTEMVQFLSKFSGKNQIWNSQVKTESKNEGNPDAMFMVQGNFDW